VIGDSRAEGNGDFRSGQPDPRGIKQSVERGLDSLTGGRLPSGFIAISGSGMGGSAVSPGLDHRAAPLQWIKDTYGSFPFEYIVDQHGNNGSQGWETMKAHAAIVRTKFPGVRYIKVTIPPNIGQNTTDAYRTLDGVTPIAAATYPSGARALLNGYILANRESTWDAVFDAGKYGMANDGVSDGQVGHTDDFMKSRFPTALRSGVLTQDWDGTSSAGMFLNFAALPGDLLNWDISNRQNSCLISTVTQISETVWQAFPENSLGLGTPVAAGATIVLIPSGDGTHEMTWVSILEQRAYEIMKAQGYFGSTPS
jgi:hypothetical protein